MVKGIILAGGTGSRLGPLSKVTNKHLLPVWHYPMIYYPISQMLANNITEICVVSGTNHLGSVVSLLGSGSAFGCQFTYKVQDGAGGIAEALELCRNFAADDDIFVILGDNIFGEILNPNTNGTLASLYLKSVPDPGRFGIAEVDHLKCLIDIEEKPENPKSNLAVTGAYSYSPYVWNVISKIDRSERGELEISDVNKLLLKRGAVSYYELRGWWSDAGTQESLLKANQEVRQNMATKLLDILEEMSRK